MRLSGDTPFVVAPSRKSAFRTLDAVVGVGINLIDTADTYGLGHNESLIGSYLRSRPSADVSICTKVGQCHDGRGQWGPLGDPRYLRQQTFASLQRLGVDQLSVLLLHRIDSRYSTRSQMDVLVEFLEAGRTESIGVSGVRATTLRTLAAEYPISFVQNRQNLRTGPDADVVTVCREFEITYIAYEPLGVGGRKQALLDIATGQGLSLQQLAIRWALSQDVLPIPGSSQPDHVADWAATEWRPLEKAVLDAVSAVTEKMVTEPEEARDG